MLRKPLSSIIILMIIWLIIPTVNATQIPLPASAWYAVTWVQATDTLHWVNAQGEQASMQRPTWTTENTNIPPQLHITPNGQTLVQVVTKAEGVQSLGFYDLQTGTLLASHDAQLNERFIWSVDNPSAIFAPRFAIGLSAPDVSQWRMIIFDTNTGQAIDQLTSGESGLLLPANSYFPYVLQYDLDEALNRWIVHFQMRTMAGEAYAYEWVAESADDALATGYYAFSPNAGYDIELLTGAPIYGVQDHAVNALIDGQLTQVITETGTINRPTWLNSSQWLGYYYQDAVFTPHWRVGNAQSNMSPIPMSPNIEALYGTPDGFLAQHAFDNMLMHMTTLPNEAHLDQFGTTVFESANDYDVIYVTPWAANFDLESINVDIVVADNVNISPQIEECEDAIMTRLEIGMRARVTYTDGTSLRVRTAPSGDIITEIQEGTEFNIIGGSVCDGGYNWWQIQTDNNMVGWSAEGFGEVYFIEQVIEGIVIVPTAVPTQLPLGYATVQPTQPIVIAPPVTAQPTQPMVLAAPVTAEPTQPMVLAAPVTAEPTQPLQLGYAPADLCTASPDPRLSIGDYAHTSTSGTLAMRTNIGDAIPTHQIPNNVTVLVLDGSQCSGNGQRMWYVQTTLNGQQVTGWLAEGWQQTYFLIPGAA